MTTDKNERLGKNERFILLLMLQGDEPQGCANPIWFELSRELKIDFGLLPKKYQHIKFRQEKSFRQSLYRLATKGLIKPLVIMRQTSSSIASPKRYGYSFYSLTPAGRVVAEKIKVQELALRDLEDLVAALEALLALGHNKVTMGQVRDVLWQSSSARFVNRPDFDAYWNNMRLGLLLQKCKYSCVRVGSFTRYREYFLA